MQKSLVKYSAKHPVKITKAYSSEIVRDWWNAEHPIVLFRARGRTMRYWYSNGALVTALMVFLLRRTYRERFMRHTTPLHATRDFFAEER